MKTQDIKPALVVMAAGMGSRYGGLKQIDPITPQGEVILDFSLYDAMMAGFSDVVLIIKKEAQDAFSQMIEVGAGRHMNIRFAFQDVRDIPEGFVIPEGREKPWGTGHAVLAARNLINGPFAVINADDYYGPSAFQSMYDFLEKAEDDDKYNYCMVGYRLDKTLSDTGHVARGVCSVSADGELTDITERTKIMRLSQPENIDNTSSSHDDDANDIAFTEDEGRNWTKIPDNTIVSMNFWGFTASFMDELQAGFPEFLTKSIIDNTTNTLDGKAEYYLPGAVDRLLKDQKARVRVLRSEDKWYGVTYKEDKPGVEAALQSAKDKGLYPEKLWG